MHKKKKSMHHALKIDIFESLVGEDNNNNK